MAEFTAGEVVVPVVPSAKDFISELKKQILPGAYGLGQSIGKDIQRGISDSLKGIYEPLKEQTQKQKQQAPKDGDDVGGAFARGFKARLQAALQSLPKIEIDAESTAAQVKIAELRARMQELSSKTVGVDLDAAAALAEVAAIQKELAALDGKDVSADVRVDIAAALADLAAIDTGLTQVDGRTVTARVHVDIAGALGSIGVLSAALAGLAAIPAAATIGAGIGALAAPLAAAGIGFAGLAAVAVPSVSRISEAVKAQEAATKSATGATTSAAATAAQAASQSYSLEQAERRIVDAKVAAKAAEEGLTAARVAAKEAAEDLARAVANAALSEESAALSVEEARKRLAQVEADPNADDLQRRRAELSVREAEQRYKDAKARNKDLQADQKAADKAGIEGSAQVVAAKDKLKQANERVRDSERQLRMLQLQQAATAAQQAAATNSVSAAQANLKKKLSELSPAAKTLMKQWKAFDKTYKAWQKGLEPAVLPALAKGLKLVQSILPKLSPIVEGVSKSLGGLFVEAKKALDTKEWKEFFAEVGKQAPTAVTNLGKSFGNIVSGIAGIIKAFLPFTGTVTGGIKDATAAFAAWGNSLGESQGFKSFIDYVRTNGPKVIEVVKNVATIIGNLFSGLSGNGAGALDILLSITEWLASLSPETLQAFVLAILGVVVAFKTWKLITTAVDGVKKSIQTVSSVVSGTKKAWEIAGGAASKAKDLTKAAASGISTAVKGIASGAGKAGTAVWTGIQTASSKAASVAKTSGTAIANAAKSAGSAAARGGTAAWNGIQVAATKAGAAARTAGTAIATAARTAGTAALGLGRVALEYGKVAAQAAIARVRTLAAAAAQTVIKVATVAWAAAQRVLNLVLSANPIGLIIAAIGLLVAGLIYAWNNSETFRTVVTAAWEAIKTAVSTAWENVIKPALTALWTFIQTTLAPVFTWLWKNVIKPAWDGISAVVTAAWTNVIRPALQGLWTFITTTLAPKITWLWENIIKPAFSKAGEAIKAAWTLVIQPALKALWAFITETLAPKISWLFENVVKPAFAKIGEVIKAAWEKVILPVFNFLKDFITKDIPTAFEKGVGLIGTAWAKIQDMAKKPVNFIIGTVYNGGIVRLWNTVADALGLELKLKEIPQLATGGIYPGYTPGRDIGLAAVSGGEAIMRPEWTRAVGPGFVDSANKAARSGGVAGAAKFMGGFANGGIIGDLLASGVKAGSEAFLNPLLDKAAAAMGNSPWAKLLVGVPKRMIAEVVAFLTKRDEETGGLSGGKAVAYAREQIGKPYEWGATGPNSFDCSGLVMRALQAAGVKGVPRVTQDQINWVTPVAKPQAGMLGFPHDGHVWLYSSPNTIIEAPQTGLNVREVAARAAQVIGRPPTYDSGGFLAPGTSLVHNGTGRPEPVLTDQQWKAVQQGGASRGGDGPMVNIEGDFITRENQTPMQIARDLSWLANAR